VLVFYPYAFSRVCTGELTALRDSQDKLAGEDVAVVAVSCDPMFTLRAFSETQKLAMPLLSDFWPHGEVSAAYGVFDAELGCARRSTFIIDRDGTVAWAVHNAMPEPRSLGQYVEVLAGLRRA
jgi:peroxiredoxin